MVLQDFIQQHSGEYGGLVPIRRTGQTEQEEQEEIIQKEEKIKVAVGRKYVNFYCRVREDESGQADRLNL